MQVVDTHIGAMWSNKLDVHRVISIALKHSICRGEKGKIRNNEMYNIIQFI